MADKRIVRIRSEIDAAREVETHRDVYVSGIADLRARRARWKGRFPCDFDPTATLAQLHHALDPVGIRILNDPPSTRSWARYRDVSFRIDTPSPSQHTAAIANLRGESLPLGLQPPDSVSVRNDWKVVAHLWCVPDEPEPLALTDASPSTGPLRLLDPKLRELDATIAELARERDQHAEALLLFRQGTTLGSDDDLATELLSGEVHP